MDKHERIRLEQYLMHNPNQTNVGTFFVILVQLADLYYYNSEDFVFLLIAKSFLISQLNWEGAETKKPAKTLKSLQAI